MDSHFQEDFTDVAFADLNPYGLMMQNDLLKTNEGTYYISITNGFENALQTKERDVLSIP
jgi:hypothetical protein